MLERMIQASFFLFFLACEEGNEMAKSTIWTRKIRSSVFGQETREPIAKSIEKKRVSKDKKMDPIEERHSERVSSISLSPITGQDDYYRLTLSRANGK